jgi:hypothetical protein
MRCGISNFNARENDEAAINLRRFATIDADARFTDTLDHGTHGHSVPAPVPTVAACGG